MQTLGEIRELLERAGHGPKKALGQNFLTDHNMIRKLVDDSGVQAGDLVLEIGPGTGALSVELLERGAQLIACELDRDLARVLRETLGERYPDRFTLIEGDCLHKKSELNREIAGLLGDRPFRMVANLPYHAATPLMIALMTGYPACDGMYVTIQREVVDRFTAKPGAKTYGTISIIAQQLGKAGMIAKLPPGCFWPQPGVDSAMMRWARNPDRAPEPERWTRFALLTQQLFQTRRKQLSGVIKRMVDGEVQWPEGVSPTDRVDSLTPDRVEALCEAIDAVH